MISLLPFFLYSQSNGSLKKQAEQFYTAGDYRAALTAYRQAGLETTSNKDIRFQLGVCHYEINDVDKAFALFTGLTEESKVDPMVDYYMGKCLQAKYGFNQARGYYKKFLQTAKPNDPLRNWVKDELIRCANGDRLKYAEEIAYVENAGTSINTQFEDFAVRTSPTMMDKIYFHSDRDDVTMAKKAGGNVDIYAVSLINGRWAVPSPLPASINSPGYDQVYGFSTNGQILYYLTPSGKNFIVRTDTFNLDDQHAGRGEFQGPFLSSHGGTDLYFFNDTICLFASDRPGGYGGYDLYISTYSHGMWSKSVNLGPEINTHFQERFPFLTKDGLTLFYSSDQLNSIGGYDVFYSSYDLKLKSWSVPVNPGLPINSPLDDTYLVLAPDGMTAYLSSDRKEGYGENDIYRVFFKKPIEAHQRISEEPTFYQWQWNQDVTRTIPKSSGSSNVEIKSYFISHLMLDDEGEVLTPQNIKKLDVLLNLLTIYPKINVQLSGFEISTGQRSFNLYFSMKKVEKAADYLFAKGIKPERVLLKGYGASYPLAKNPPGSASNTSNKINQRIEIDLLHTATEPVDIHTEKLKVPENLRDPKGAYFNSMRHGLYYGVQIASVTQILQNDAIEQVEEMFIDKDRSTGQYHYFAGMSSTYKGIEPIKSNMITLGFPDAKVVAFMDGERVDPRAIPDLAKQFPDLLFFMNANRK